METLQGIGRLLSGAMTLKAETDYWNSHSDSYKATVWTQIFIGMALAAVAYWAYMNNPVGTPNSTVPILFLLGYIGVCWALNSKRNLDEKSFASQNLSEFWLFGFFKGDDFMGGVIFGWILAAACAYGIFSSLVLHQTIPLDLRGNSRTPSVVHSAPAHTHSVAGNAHRGMHAGPAHAH